MTTEVLPILALIPDQAGYSAKPGAETLSTKLSGGLSRYRRDIVGAAAEVDVRWTVGPTDYAYLQAFYRTTVAEGASPFHVFLILNSPMPVQYKAFFIPGSFKLTSAKGYSYTVAAELEVVSVPPDGAYDASLVDLYSAYGHDAENLWQVFEELSNTDMPGYMGAD